MNTILFNPRLVFILVFSLSSSKAWEAKFEYYIFENFETTRQLFSTETNIIGRLREWRTRIKDCAYKLLNGIPSKKSNEQLKFSVLGKESTRIFKKFSINHYQQCGRLDNSFENKLNINDKTNVISRLYSNYSKHDILIGAAGGFLMLQEAYDINLDDAENRLILDPYSKSNTTQEYVSHGHFDAADLMLIASFAFQNRWTVNAQQFISLSKTKHFSKMNFMTREDNSRFSDMLEKINTQISKRSEQMVDGDNHAWELSVTNSNNGNFSSNLITDA